MIIEFVLVSAALHTGRLSVHWAPCHDGALHAVVHQAGEGSHRLLCDDVFGGVNQHPAELLDHQPRPAQRQQGEAA